MRDYEVTIILQPELDDQGREQILERVQGWLVPEGNAEELLTVDHWGQRQLAYPIEDHKRGYYVYYEAKLEPSRIREIERNMMYNDDILRSLIVRKES